ncbi:RNA-binding protein [Peribacillus acanthi]|uniref:YlmH family RNA-binding protein n=1 Tax=Peribacillus acanthi TaxID=2171554 RepID=UPI000D3E1893|nr:RNA-binding protein [Peribacillus acanthi]
MSIYQHFRAEEKEFIDQVLEWKEYVSSAYTHKLTDFLDPREQQIVQSLIGKEDDVRVTFYGGSDDSERKRALLYPDYFQPEVDDFAITVFEVKYPKKFVTLEHRQVLGTIMSLGLKREKFGDVILQGDRIQFIAAAEIESYVENNLDKVGKAGISLEKVSLDAVIQSDQQWQELVFTASSMRLDVLISSMTNLSRQKSQMLIEGKRVKVNHKLIENTSFECGEGDVFSVRGFGRFKIISIDGKTKKDKWRIQAGKQK